MLPVQRPSLPPAAVSQSTTPSEQTGILPDELLVQIFSLFKERSTFFAASLVCRHWCSVTRDATFWRPAAKHAFPEQERILALYSTNIAPAVNWHQLVLRQKQMAAPPPPQPKGVSKQKPQTSPVKLKTLPDQPCPKDVHVDLEGRLYTAEKLTLKMTDHSATSLISLKEHFPDLQSFTICSVRARKTAFLQLKLKKSSQLVAFNLKDRAIVWRGSPNENYVFPGGLNHPVGFVRPKSNACWNRLNSQARQQMELDSLSPYFFTTRPSPSDPSVPVFLPYNLNHPATPLAVVELQKGEGVKHIDCNLEGDFFVITAESKEGMCRHFITTLRNGNIDFCLGHSVLAFDAERSIAVLHNPMIPNGQSPLNLVGKDLQLKPLSKAVHGYTHYMAQIKGNRIALFGVGPNSASDLFLIDLNDLNKANKVAYRDNFMVRSFTLYDDFLVLLTKTQDDKLGPLIFYDLQKMEAKPLYKGFHNIIGREGSVLLCQSHDGIYKVNLKNGLIEKYSSCTDRATYLAGTLFASS